MSEYTPQPKDDAKNGSECVLQGVMSCTLPRLVISSTSGGGGKTMLSLGLARHLRNAGHAVLPIKKGPDYIDAAWLAAAAGRPASNLDPYVLDAAGLRAQLANARQSLIADSEQPHAFAVIEGNRGLFDGMDVSGSCSTATLARDLSAPILLTLNVTKMTRTVAALLQGLAGFEKGLHFAGVILNRTGSARHADYIRRSIEEYTDFEVLGELPRQQKNLLPERHMGIASLKGDSLSESAEETLDSLAGFVSANVDVDKIVSKASLAPDLEAGPFWRTPVAAPKERPAIGYVRDACLWFYYRENLEALERAGARLVRLSLFDAEPWSFSGSDALDAVYFGGGFPEDYLDQLSASPRLKELALMAEQGLPVYAECGGLMVLARSISKDGRKWPMANVLPVDIVVDKRPKGLGYVQGEVLHDTPFYPKGFALQGHEFHYSLADAGTMKPEDAALKLTRGTGLNNGLDAVVSNAVWGSYTHIFAPAVPSWAARFCELAAQWHNAHSPKQN